MKTSTAIALFSACAALGALAQNSPPPPRQQPSQQPAPRPPMSQPPRGQQQSAQQQQQQGLSSFGWFADLANACWRGERPDGRADVQCYSTQFNRYLRGTIKFYQGANVVAEGDSVFSWDPSAHVIVYNQWASNGGFGLGEIAIEGNDLVFRTRLPDGSEAPARAVWRRVDKDTFRVIRQRRNDEGEGWTDDTSVTYKRVAS
jgi:hypothetical protein